MNKDFDISEELKKLPDKPGVYIMHDDKDAIIYVGKAVVLKNRVRSYFRESTRKTPKIQEMVKKIDYFEYIVTDSELEALVLENNLIKEHRPKYNTLLKDDKTYPYIKVTVNEEYPRILFSRLMKKDKSRYFGPFTSASSVKNTIELINKIYKLRNCSRRLPADIGKERACLNHHIKRCLGPCNGYCSKEEYSNAIKGALEFLNGNYGSVIKDLENKMNEASEKMEYEDAIEYRDLLNSVKSIAQKQKITSFDGEDRDIIAVYGEKNEAVVQVFFIRDGRMIGREHFYMKNVYDTNESEIISDFIKQFYSGTPFIPKELMLQCEVEDQLVLEEWLSSKRGNKVGIMTPKKGQKERLVELAIQNAKTVLDNDRDKIKRAESRTIGAVKEISDLLGLEKITRMEAFDISNISGVESVGSMVVYENGQPKKSDYRKFKIKSVIGPNDYASMDEVITRRFEHGLSERQDTDYSMKEYGSFTKFPDLIMMDGGKGQVHAALKVLEKLNLDIPVCGMVKDDHHRTRGLYYEDKEIPIDTHSEGFRLITRIQDEAHRFAIEYHRSLRSKAQVKSILDDIEGIGPKRRKALLRKFISVENIKDADLDELINTESMNEEAAKAVYNFFHH